jgi:addiction module HigA family antidote
MTGAKVMEMKRKPTMPGEILRDEFLIPLAITQKKLADHISCDIKVINRIVNGRSALTPELAVKLGAALNTSAEFWLNAQKAIDLYEASRSVKKLPKPIFKKAA